MAAPTVLHDVPHDVALDGLGQLFAGKRFWVAQRVPSRNRLIDDIRANGGDVIFLERKADYLIADPFRRDCPSGSISYEFVEHSIQHGQVRDARDYFCVPPEREARAPGAVHRPAKGSRTAYTAEEDRILYKWVRDAEAAGRLAKGNEIYKQLEAKYPRHPWQSWRDRYIKHLQNRPPSAFNIPDNAPPSPPSDAPAELPRPDERTLEQLAGLFSSDDWEELYAFVDIIDGLAGQDSYATSWAEWAKQQGNQTAQQWQQYYEKVVRPQWLRDPAWKREQIKTKVDRKHSKRSRSVESLPGNQESHQQPATVLEPGLGSIISQKVDHPAGLVLEEKTLSSSTARHESPVFLADLCEKATKPFHEDGALDEDNDRADFSRPAKRPRSASASPSVISQSNQPATHSQKPVQISSSASSLSTTSSGDEERSQQQIQRDITTTLITPKAEELKPVNHFDSNESTPDARHPRASNFDTQAILASPGRLPQSTNNVEDAKMRFDSRGASSPPRHPESDASTTRSLQEFRRSLDLQETARTPFSQDHSGSLFVSLSPISSSSSPIDSGDPDIPLAADEIDGFFEEQYADGFNNNYIVTALKRTRLRPGLAIKVLHAWKMGHALPNERGIWSLEDDEAVESGDGVALAKLERKHTLDGWGGITERLIFLEADRN